MRVKQLKNMNTTTEIETTFEALIDRHGLRNVLCVIEHVCHEKAEHINANWQDKTLAKKWAKAGNAIRGSANSAIVCEISPLTDIY